MAAVLREPFDPAAFIQNQMAHEASLLETAKSDQSKASEARCAAAELALLNQRGLIFNPKVKEAITDALNDYWGRSAHNSLAANRALPISPLLVLRNVSTEEKRGRKSASEHELAMAFGSLSQDDVREALKSKPAKLHHAERKLVEFVAKRYPGLKREMYVEFVQCCLHWWPWNERDRAMHYDADY